MSEFFANIPQSVSGWATPLHVVGLVLMLLSFTAMLFSKQINKLIQKKREGDYTFSIRLIGWGLVMLFAVLTII